ncbi:MAG: hypothetical protein JNJ77_18970 [Planctomycetia bacterium]|nr:hypothetical protein [Planctomycetia bacterium]
MAARSKKTDPRLAKIYADVRRNFTAADLQKYTEVTPTVPLLSIIEELEDIQSKHDAKKSRTGKRRRKTA